MTLCAIPTVQSHPHIKDRRAFGGKRLASKNFPGKFRSAARRSLDPCDNSNDSGLGFDQHTDQNHSYAERLAWSEDRTPAKRQKLNIKLEDDEVNDNYTFPDSVRTCKDNNTIIRSAPPTKVTSFSMNSSPSDNTSRSNIRCASLGNRSSPSPPFTLTSQFSNVSKYADISLTIISQPEQQHRARYQTEGSRGAVKDRSGNSFPVVQLNGYNKPATMQVFIGTDVGKVAPHMFYQACRVSGKNSTPCMERKIEGTVVIELQLDPSKEMVATCDCVGILKERNVDVEHRFPDQTATRNKKKSTRCRMVFRTTIVHDNGVQEVLQVCSQPIACTQPPGVPEISKKSLTSCPASGGLELFILGKNFLKDTRVFFQQSDEHGIRWEQSVVPDKEFLQQTHLVCVIPPYVRNDIIEPVTIRLFVVSSGKTSEPHQFVYTPTSGAVSSARDISSSSTSASPFLNKMLWCNSGKQEQDMDMMPPPGTNQIPLSQRRASSTKDAQSPPLLSFKQEMVDENSQNSIMDPLEGFRHLSESSMDVHTTDSNITIITDNSVDILRGDNSNLSVPNKAGVDVMTPTNLSVIREEVLEPNTFQINGNVNGFKRSFLETTNSINSHISNSSMSANDLNVIDLRMKLNPDVNLTSTSNLQNFSVPASTPLLAQSGQSVENYLSSIETSHKDIIQSSQSQKIISESPLTLPLLQNVARMSTNDISIKNEMKNEEKVLIRTNSSTSSGKLSTIMTSGESQDIKMEDVVVRRPQDILLPNKPPLQMSTTLQTQNILSSSQNLMLNSFDVSSLHGNVSAQPSLSPEVILNSQTSPSMMCSAPALSQDNLSLCNSVISTAGTDLIQQQQLSPLLDNDPSKTLATQNSTSLATQLSSVISSSEPEKAILLKAAVDLFETQKKITALEPILSTTTSTIEQHIINDILTTKSPQGDILKSNLTYIESQTPAQTKMIPMNVIANKTMESGVKQTNMEIAAHTQTERKTEDRMIPHGFATMSENELINIINPSCFDQV